jgi:hypothetical protein
MATSLLSRPRNRIAREFNCLVDELSTYEYEFREKFDSAVTDEMEKVRGLEGLADSDRDRIWTTLNDAARCYHSVHWETIFAATIETRKRMRTAMAAGLVLLAAIFIIFIFPPPISGILNGANAFCAAMIASALFLIGKFLYLRMPYRYSGLALAVAVAAGFMAVREYSRWSVYVLAWNRASITLVPLQAELRAQIMSAPVAAILRLAIWIVTVICVMALAKRWVRYVGMILASTLDAPYSRATQQSAEMIIGFLDVSHYATKLIRRIQGFPVYNEVEDEDEGEDLSRPSAGGLLSYDERSELSDLLDLLARLASRSWMRAMGSHHGLAGQWVAGYARRIEFFIRHQESKNVLMGTGNLAALREAMTSAMVQAADGNWHLIGSDNEYATDAIVGRRKLMLRRAIAISIPVAGAIAAGHFLKAPYAQAIILTCLGFAGVQLLALIDPDSPLRLDVATKLVGMFKRGNS